MSIIEIISGVVLILAALAIVGLTLAQESKGKGLSGAIMGDNSMMEAGRTRAKDAKMAKATKILGIVFIVVTILVSVLSVMKG
ncbi:hypothetical protein CE91St44_21050 [Oscillospiraceae bacterium]|uniref:preprotein translocase subunit SecG n=1 Tax=Allofournierella sp. TaxID=1940256 RepID=UPI0015AB3128|nr:hypothetical protein CE91St44_21050 [Oscillospiraceae bacterium]